MRSDVIVLPEPLIDDDLLLIRGGEPFGAQNFVAQRAIEPLFSILTEMNAGLVSDLSCD